MIPHKLIKLSSCNSTNLYIKEHLETLLAKTNDSKALICLLANTQTDGRGQFNRKWLSPEGNLYLSMVYLIKKNHRSLHNFAQLLSLSAAIYLEKQGLPAEIKWPNDIYLQNKKLGGCLIEIVNRENDMAVISGIGLNIKMEREDLNRIDQAAISIEDYIQQKKKNENSHLQINYHVGDVAAEIIEIYKSLLSIYLKDGFAPFTKRYESFLRKSPIKFCLNKKEIVGEFAGIYPDGRLQIISNGTNYLIP